MRVEDLLLIMVAATAVAFLMQCIVVWATFKRARRLTDKLEKQTEGLRRDITEVVAGLKQTAEGLQPLTHIVSEINRTSTLLSQMIQERTRDADYLLKDLIQFSREQSAKVDYVVTDTVQKFEQVTSTIQRDVLQPVAEISSLVKGVRAGLGYLFSRKASHPKDVVSEEELFI
ncbi:MAG: hypothetical protein HY645_01850 [Acidobacteria bacterium]|nr:hypothetical protein [Acidobacteriota bacterium]